MKPLECVYEADVLAAAMESRWPDGAEAQLRAHAATCAVCSEAALVAGAIREASLETRSSTVVPDSGRVWHQAQIRARREAIAAAARPITAVQLVAFACATGLLGACFGATSSWFQAALQKIASTSFAPLLAQHASLAIAGAAALLLVPAAAWFAIARSEPNRPN
ncbi:MAG TPA: hypothetical protein VEV85_26905 [Bryobacteraceae bacterium]|nr:hypothetical protein [Bryobacteraceae bacterium]